MKWFVHVLWWCEENELSIIQQQCFLFFIFYMKEVAFVLFAYQWCLSVSLCSFFQLVDCSNILFVYYDVSCLHVCWQFAFYVSLFISCVCHLYDIIYSLSMKEIWRDIHFLHDFTLTCNTYCHCIIFRISLYLGIIIHSKMNLCMSLSLNKESNPKDTNIIEVCWLFDVILSYYYDVLFFPFQSIRKEVNKSYEKYDFPSFFFFSLFVFYFLSMFSPLHFSQEII